MALNLAQAALKRRGVQAEASQMVSLLTRQHLLRESFQECLSSSCSIVSSIPVLLKQNNQSPNASSFFLSLSPQKQGHLDQQLRRLFLSVGGQLKQGQLLPFLNYRSQTGKEQQSIKPKRNNKYCEFTVGLESGVTGVLKPKREIERRTLFADQYADTKVCQMRSLTKLLNFLPQTSILRGISWSVCHQIQMMFYGLLWFLDGSKTNIRTRTRLLARKERELPGIKVVGGVGAVEAGGYGELLADNNVEIQMDFEYQYYEGAAIALIVINTVSFLALLFVIVIYLVRWKQIASFPMRISFYLCVSCIVQNLYVLTYPPMLVYQHQSSGDSAGGYCVFEGMLKTSFDLSSIIWTLIIIYSSYATVVHGYTLERMEWFYLGVGFLLPIILSVIPAVLEEYGFNTYFCWFDAPTSSLQFGLKLGYFFGPLWVFFFLEMFWAYRTYHKLKEVGLEERELNIFKKIMLFPIILLITGTFATARLIYNFVTSQNGSWLDAASLILLSTYGLFTSVAYGLNPLIRDQIMIMFGKEVDPSSRHSSFTSSQSSRRTDVIAELITL